VSEITRALTLTSGLVFEDRGHRTLNGFPGQWRLFAYQARSERTRRLHFGHLLYVDETAYPKQIEIAVLLPGCSVARRAV
jgi:hypothetical protein